MHELSHLLLTLLKVRMPVVRPSSDRAPSQSGRLAPWDDPDFANNVLVIRLKNRHRGCPLRRRLTVPQQGRFVAEPRLHPDEGHVVCLHRGAVLRPDVRARSPNRSIAASVRLCCAQGHWDTSHRRPCWLATWTKLLRQRPMSSDGDTTRHRARAHPGGPDGEGQPKSKPGPPSSPLHRSFRLS
jgi:hypothetical protein